MPPEHTLAGKHLGTFFTILRSRTNERNEGDQSSQHLAGAFWELLVASQPELLLIPPPRGDVVGEGPSRGPVVLGLILSLLAKPRGYPGWWLVDLNDPPTIPTNRTR